MNKIIIKGNVGKFIATKTTKTNKPFLCFTIAENHVDKRTGEIFTSWHNIKCSQPGLLDYFNHYGLQPGDFVQVEGCLNYFQGAQGYKLTAIWIFDFRLLKKKTIVEEKKKKRKAA